MLSYLFEAVLPIFAIGALGYFFGKKNIFDNLSAFSARSDSIFNALGAISAKFRCN
jgi:predicted permease